MNLALAGTALTTDHILASSHLQKEGNSHLLIMRFSALHVLSHLIVDSGMVLSSLEEDEDMEHKN